MADLSTNLFLHLSDPLAEVPAQIHDFVGWIGGANSGPPLPALLFWGSGADQLVGGDGQTSIHVLRNKRRCPDALRTTAEKNTVMTGCYC